jgi:16S rRNA (cytosine967-C5)-methyltransferase
MALDSRRSVSAKRVDVRSRAIDILLRVEKAGAWASVLLEHAEAQIDDRRDRALLHELVLGVLRRRATLDHLIQSVSSRPIERVDPMVMAAIRIGAYTMTCLDRIPKHAAVSTSVEVIRERRPRATGFANAILRAISKLDEESAWPAEPQRGELKGLAMWTSHPLWWVERLVERLGWVGARNLLVANNRPAATHLRPNTIGFEGQSLEDFSAELLDQGCLTRPGRVVPDALRVVDGSPTSVLSEGRGWVQDEASQLVTLLADAGPGMSVLDCCAAPGGKTMHLASAVGVSGWVVAVDRHAGRMRRLHRNLERTAMPHVVTMIADMTGETALGGKFDRVLVDAPCSGSGTLRRHPEIRWRLEPEAIKLLAERQVKLLGRAADRLLERGRLIYSVCSIEPEEGEQVIEAFLAGRP